MASTTRVESRLLGNMIRASKDFKMIEPGDRIMACMSGGKDSYAMLHLLRLVQKRVPFTFEIVAVNLDQGHPGFPGFMLENYLKENGDTYRMLKQDTHSIVKEKVPEGKTFCSLCSRLRRGILYNAAVELGCTKIALGHHRDDLIETAMLNLLFSGQLKTMPPKLFADDGKNIVIRPMAYCAEEEIAELAELVGFPILPCNLCGSQENMQRQQVKAMIGDLHARNGNVKGNMLAALGNVRVSHLLDRALLAQSGAPTGTDDSMELL